MSGRFCPKKGVRGGFSLVELLIACALLGILAAWTVPAFIRFSNRQEVLRGEAAVRDELYTVQNRAVSGVDRVSSGVESYWWGVEFLGGTGNYNFLRSKNAADPTVHADEIVARANTLTGADLEFVADVTVWFKMITGELLGAEEETVVIRRSGGACTGESDPSGDCREVIVHPGGRID